MSVPDRLKYDEEADLPLSAVELAAASYLEELEPWVEKCDRLWAVLASRPDGVAGVWPDGVAFDLFLNRALAETFLITLVKDSRLPSRLPELIKLELSPHHRIRVLDDGLYVRVPQQPLQPYTAAALDKPEANKAVREWLDPLVDFLLQALSPLSA